MANSELNGSLEDPASPWEKQLLLWTVPLLLLLAALDAVYFRPGYAGYDEEAQLDLLQSWREGLALPWRFAFGSLHRSMIQALFGLLGPNEAWLRLPSLLAVGLEAALLFVWLKPRLGERAALWACLAELICTATFARARSMLSPALLPAIFLAHAVWLDRLRKPWQHALFGFSLAFWCLDYEGWLMALACLLPAWAWRTWRGPQRNAASFFLLLGLAVGTGLVVMLSPELAAYGHNRSGVSVPLQGLLAQAWQNFAALLGGGNRLAFSAADRHPWPAPWIWALCLAGMLPLWKHFRGAWWLLLIGCAPLAMKSTSWEPHRLSLALLALAAMAGAGAAWAWRWKAVRAALPLLLAAGLAHEAYAWATVDRVHLAYAYGRSQNLKAAVSWLRKEAPPQGWQVLDGLGPFSDASFRLLLDIKQVPRRDGVPVALLHWDYLPALKGLKGKVLPVDGSGYLPLYLYFPTAAEIPHLQTLRSELAPLQRLRVTAYPQAIQALALSRLGDPALRDPWARSVYWDAWMQAQQHLHSAAPDALKAAFKEPLVDGWLFDAWAADPACLPAEALIYRQRSEAADPRRSALYVRAQLY